MIQILPEWIVNVSFQNNKITFGISDNFVSNVLRKVADLNFNEPVTKIEILPRIISSSNVITEKGWTIGPDKINDQ